MLGPNAQTHTPLAPIKHAPNISTDGRVETAAAIVIATTVKIPSIIFMLII